MVLEKQKPSERISWTRAQTEGKGDVVHNSKSSTKRVPEFHLEPPQCAAACEKCNGEEAIRLLIRTGGSASVLLEPVQTWVRNAPDDK